MISLLKFLLRCSSDLFLSKIKIAIVVVTGLLAGICNAALIALINSLSNGADSIAGRLAWAFGCLCLMMFASRVVSGMVLNHLSQTTMFELTLKMSRRILSTSLRQLESLGAPRLLATLTHDVPVISSTFSALPVLFMHVAILVGSLVYLGWLSIPVLGLVLGFVLVGVASYQLPIMRAVRYLKRARDERDNLVKQFRALTEGTKELKLNRQRRNDFLDRHLQPSADSVRRNNILGNAIYTVASSWGHLLMFLLIGMLFFVAPKFVAVNQQILIGYVIVLLYMMTPLEAILSFLPLLGQVEVSAKKIEQLGLSLEAQAPEIESKLEPDNQPPWTHLQLAGVTHSYYSERDGDVFTLGPLDLVFRPGELVFLIGGNGSGKTTFAKLLTGLYIPESGEIRLSGQPVTDGSRELYRQQFSVIFSDFYLFDNLIGLAQDGADPKIQSYLSQLQLDRKLQISEGVFSTVDLSQGQRKRLTLLNAYIEDRPIYVFDEWAADQEPLFKTIFYSDILPRLKARGKLVIVISHDDRYYGMADRIIKLEYGKVECDTQLTGELTLKHSF